MSYASFSDGEKAAVQDLAQYIREMSGELARIGNHGRAVASKYVGNVETIIGSLSSNDIIPNTSGLDGAQDLTKQEFQNLVGYAMTASDTTDNASGSINTNYHRSLYAKAAGIKNLIG